MLRSERRFEPLGNLNNCESALAGTFRRMDEILTRGDPLPALVATGGNQSQGDSSYHSLGSWQVARSCYRIAQKWNSPEYLPTLFFRTSSSGGGLFGRPVILWIRGASYLQVVFA